MTKHIVYFKCLLYLLCLSEALKQCQKAECLHSFLIGNLQNFCSSVSSPTFLSISYAVMSETDLTLLILIRHFENLVLVVFSFIL